MATEQQEERQFRFRRTVSLQETRGLAKIRPFQYFEEFPFDEIREICLKTIREEHPVVDRNLADWAEACITDLVRQQDPLWENILSWYLFGTKETTLIAQSIEFTISLADIPGIGHGYVSKLLAGKFERLQAHGPYSYPLSSALKKFLSSLLEELMPSSGSGVYDEDDWYRAERALRIIASQEYHSFLPKIEELITLHQEGKIFPLMLERPYRQNLAHATNIATLRAVASILRNAHKKRLQKH